MTENGTLTIVLSDGSSVDLGNIKGEKGDKGDPGEAGAQGDPGGAGRGVASMAFNASGELIVTYTDGTTANLGTVPNQGGTTTTEAEWQYYQFQPLDDGTLAIVGLTELGIRQETLIVPAYAYGKKVTVLKKYAFTLNGAQNAFNETTKTLVLPDTITAMEDNALRNFAYGYDSHNLSVNLPSSVQYVGYRNMGEIYNLNPDMVIPEEWYVTIGTIKSSAPDQVYTTAVELSELRTYMTGDFSYANLNGSTAITFTQTVSLGGYEFKKNTNYYMLGFTRK